MLFIGELLFSVKAGNSTKDQCFGWKPEAFSLYGWLWRTTCLSRGLESLQIAYCLLTFLQQLRPTSSLKKVLKMLIPNNHNPNSPPDFDQKVYLRYIRKGIQTNQRNDTFSPKTHLPSLCKREIGFKDDLNLDSESESCWHSGGTDHQCDVDGQGLVTVLELTTDETWSIYELKFNPWGSRGFISELTLGESTFSPTTVSLITIASPIQEGKWLALHYTCFRWWQCPLWRLCHSCRLLSTFEAPGPLLRILCHINNSHISLILWSACLPIKKPNKWSSVGHCIAFSRYICFGFTIYT